jgi:hypothetical protein
MKQDQQDTAKINSQLNNAPSPLSSAVGIDLGDRWSRYCVVNSVGEVVIEDRVRTTPEGMERPSRKCQQHGWSSKRPRIRRG